MLAALNLLHTSKSYLKSQLEFEKPWKFITLIQLYLLDIWPLRIAWVKLDNERKKY